MKKISIIEELPCEKDVCKKDNCAECYTEHSKVEQVPETYEELKQLIKETVFEDDKNGVKMGQCIKIEYILIDGKSFMPDGEILDEDNDVFAQHRTPQQMWQIIKNLVGE